MIGASTLANVAWMAANANDHRRFRKALHNVRATQTSILEHTLRANSQTAFGRRWSFASVQSPQQYQQQVPLSTYEDYEESIERIAAGKTHVLTQDAVRLFELSSGSTQAAKWIPYTSALQAEMRRAVAAWVFDLAQQHPTILRGRSYWSVSPALRRDVAKGSRVPVGFDSDSAYLGGGFRHLVDATLAVPSQVARIDDLELFRRVTLLYLLCAADLRLVSVWHPSFWMLLWAFLEDNWDMLLADLQRGLHLPSLGIQLPAQARHARALSHLADITPGAIWPHLRLISCWGDGHAELALPELSQRFPSCVIQPKGLIATEGIVSLPFAGQRPLAVTSHFFEFLDANGTPHFAWELEQGAQYSVVMTTAGGLYRYQLQDVIEVTGFLQQTPCLRFLHKEDHISDLCGEKLHEGFVAAVVQVVLQSADISARFAMLAPRCGDHQPQYVLYLETESTGTLDRERMSADLEAGLRRNPHYEYCSGLNQLRPATVELTAPRAFESYANRLRQNGQKLGNIKPTMLSSLTDWDQWLCDMPLSIPE